ncbi:MAG TPA: aldose 1-epimerase [Ktedonobacteraceae bacterium]|nr:aldose 1-epimerase [Ktedonobacteraceae bacterium]
MTGEQNQISSTGDQPASNRHHTAEVGRDQALQTTTITLSSTDQSDTSRNILICIAPEFGSNLFRFRVGEHELIYTDESLLKQRDFTGTFVLWPFPNRVRDKRYIYQGQRYSLENVHRPGGDAALVHGLVFDRPWHYAQPVIGPDAVSVTTFVDMNVESPYYSAYPFDSRLSLTYALSGTELSVTYEVYNKSDRTLPFGFSLHPYLSTFEDKRHVLLSLPAQAVMEADDELLPTGRIFDVRKVMYAMYDLREPVPVANLKLDHVYTRLVPPALSIIDFTMLAMQLHITATDDFTHQVIYTPPHLPSFCIEYQTCSTDAINLYHQSSTLREAAHLLEVQSGATYSGTLHYSVVFTA